MTEDSATTVPVSVITGFLGSGKTTVLANLLTHSGMDETAVLINEIGAVGLDHLLVGQIDDEIMMLNGGCICCTVRGDLVEYLDTLFRKRDRRAIPQFRRIVIETTGLADPAPIIYILLTDDLLTSRCRLDGLITTVDTVHGDGQLDTHMEAVKQVAMADRILLTKADMAGSAALTAITARLRRLNPAAPILHCAHGNVAPADLFGVGLFDTEAKIPDVRRWLRDEAYAPRNHQRHGHGHRHGNEHDDRIATFCLTLDSPVDWDEFVDWLEILIASRGKQLLRIKGILNVSGRDQPVVIQGVQHVFHQPVTLDAWPDDDRRSRIVFVTRDLGRAAVEASFKNALGLPTDPAPAVVQ